MFKIGDSVIVLNEKDIYWKNYESLFQSFVGKIGYVISSNKGTRGDTIMVKFPSCRNQKGTFQSDSPALKYYKKIKKII